MMPLFEAAKLWPEFETFADPVLEKLVVQAATFWQAMKRDSSPYILSLVGTCGTGKTFLAERLYASAMANARLLKHQWLLSPVRKVRWMDTLDQILERDHRVIDELAATNFLLIDEVSFPKNREGNMSEWALERLTQLISRRMGRWTVLTANVDPNEIEKADARIISRLIRDGNRLVKVTTQDYWLRPRNHAA